MEHYDIAFKVRLFVFAVLVHSFWCASTCCAVEVAVNPQLWRNSVEVQINGYQGSTALQNFPVLVVLDPALVEGFSYADCASNGADLRFTDEDNTQLLDHEIELWNTSGSSRIWVRVPSLVPNRVIRAFWNNPAAIARPSSGTWNSGFCGVWHLADTLQDATTNQNNAVNSGTTAITGTVGAGRSFDGNAYLDCGNGPSLNSAANAISLSAWIKPDVISGNAIISKSYNAAHSSPYYAWVLYAVNSGLHCRIDTVSATKGTLRLGAWQHVAATYNGTAISYFIDGSFVGSVAKTGNTLSTDRNVRIGGRHTSTLGEFFKGSIDEVRISSVARSADWIKAECDTVTKPSFCVFGEVSDNSTSKISLMDTQCVEGNHGATQLVFEVTLSIASTNPVSFHYAASYGSADATDITLTDGDMVIPPGERKVLISFPVVGDEVSEQDETVYLELSNIVGATPLKTHAWGLILDDDRNNPLSPLDLVADPVRARLYVARHTDHSLAVIDTKRDCLIQAFALPEEPNNVMLNRAGTRLFTAAGGPSGHLYVLDALTGTILQTIAAGHTPMAPLLSPDEKTLYLCNRFDDDVLVINLSDGVTLARIPVTRQPVAAALSQNGERLFVAEFLPAGPSTNALIAAAVNVIDTTLRTITRRITLPAGTQSIRGMAISGDGSTLFVTHLISHFQIPTTQVLRGWMNTAALTVINVASEQIINTVLLDDLDLGAANPWGVICSTDNRTLCVSHAGTHEVSVIDQAALLAKLQTSDATTSRDFTYLLDLRRRIPLLGNSPRALALVGNKLFAAEYYSDSIAVADLTPGSEYSAIEIPAGVPRVPDAVRRGERNYNDAMLCLQQWQSCASCHPDARADALNWDLINDGFGNPKNTKSHLFSMQTPPAMVTGIRASSQVAVRSGLKYIQFVNCEDSYAQDMDAYLTAMQPTPSPYLVNGTLSAAAVRGQALFASRGCVDCHSGEYFTDLAKHDVNSGIGSNAGVAFDTPTLREIWRTAPYLHDGRLENVRDVVTQIQGNRVSGLPPAEIDDLVEYLLSL